jgi:SAM-dependent methyltransferase
MGKKKDFWNKEYAAARSFALSDEPAEDLIKFTRFLQRESGKSLLNVTRRALDVGCGNGRNLIYLAETFGMHGLGYDLSSEAIAQARKNSAGLSLEFTVQNLADPIPLPDASVTIALDMMASHVLKSAERANLRAELARVVRPGGWLLFKSFLLEEDRNAQELLRDHPGPEAGMYLHPRIHVAEYVWPTTAAVAEFWEDAGFTVRKINKSFKHVTRAGTPWKRRSVIAYLEKK